jgi:mRNA-degrading endonuclease toxin of MazEF toxin-antitoxin module
MPLPNVPMRKRTFCRDIRWGDVYWFDFGQPVSGQRTFALPHPAVVVNDTTATLPGSVLLVPLTDLSHKRAGYEFHVDVTLTDCPQLDKDSVAKTDQVFCVSRRPYLPDQYYIATLDVAVMRRIYAKLLRALNVGAVLQP